MTDDGPRDASAQSPAELKETFATIGNETRAEILRILGDDPYSGVSFSELRSRMTGRSTAASSTTTSSSSSGSS